MPLIMALPLTVAPVVVIRVTASLESSVVKQATLLRTISPPP